MQCTHCHTENRPGRRFCAECGAPLALACAACGFANEPGEKFCGGCGTPLSTAPHTPEPLLPSPQAYTPSHLTDKILAARPALAGERKLVTVLFADLKGSMELLAERDPEDARQLLDPVLERMMEAVHRYEGTVNQVMGDGIMALFGAPIAHEDHAVRACYAALRMQETVKHYATEVQRTQGVPIHIRVGLNAGEVVVRAIGSDLHMDYTAVGQTTHLAARMEQMAMPGSTLITAAVLALAEGFIEIKPLGPVPVKGLVAPVEVYEVVDVGLVRTRLQAAVARGLTRFVGRDPELDTLTQALARAGAGHGQVVALVGEAGVGKSRLVYEFLHAQYTQGWLVLTSNSVSYGKATLYLPVLDLLKGYCGIDSRDDLRRRREKVVGKVLGLDEALRPTLPAILALLEVPVDEPQWQALDPPQRRQRTLDAIKCLLLRESQVQPLLVVFEDLHWIDTETQALLDSLAGRVADAVPLLTQAIVGRGGDWGRCHLPLGEAQMLAGHLEEAHALAERALALTRERQQRGLQAYALRLLGDIAAQREPSERQQAEAHYQQALALAEELGMRPLQAHCHSGLGRLYTKTGQQEQARAALSTAMEMYRTMEMTFWLPHVEAALAQGDRYWTRGSGREEAPGARDAGLW